MPTMTSYRHGVPAWIDVSSPDVEASAAFYASLFGWEVGPDMGPDAGGYRLFSLNGHSVAGIGPLMDGPPSWTTYINVADLDATAAGIAPAGGTVVVPPMDLPDGSGRMAIAIDPTGGFFALYQAGPNHFGAAIVNEPGALTWNELNTRDTAAATAFYDRVLGWSTTPMDPNDPSGYHLINVDGRAVAGLNPMDHSFPPEVPTHWATYFAVADLDATIAQCAAIGGGVVAPRFDTPVGPMAVLSDPAGAMFSIGQFDAIDDPHDWPS
jgi:uncharacterized protein